jgi:hypothetical protein
MALIQCAMGNRLVTYGRNHVFLQYELDVARVAVVRLGDFGVPAPGGASTVSDSRVASSFALAFSRALRH